METKYTFTLLRLYVVSEIIYTICLNKISEIEAQLQNYINLSSSYCVYLTKAWVFNQHEKTKIPIVIKYTSRKLSDYRLESCISYSKDNISNSDISAYLETTTNAKQLEFRKCVYCDDTHISGTHKCNREIHDVFIKHEQKNGYDNFMKKFESELSKIQMYCLRCSRFGHNIHTCRARYY